MTHHTIITRLGVQDSKRVTLSRRDTRVTEVSFVDGDLRLGYGLGQALDQLHSLGLRPTERAVDLALLAASVTAADTRISRATQSQDRWTREIDLHVPVSEPRFWMEEAPLIATTLNFLSGDRWVVHFRQRPNGMASLTAAPEKLKLAMPSCVCLFSGGLDSFIGALDLLVEEETPLLVSHYWDGITSKHQTYCYQALRRRFSAATFHHLRARVGFPSDAIEGSSTEPTQRARSFLFFALAALAASALEEPTVVHVPENGLISLNVPLDPLRLGALSTRTTHPYFMARFNDLLANLNMPVRLENRYRHKTKGEMVSGCGDPEFLRREAKNTMSCSAPTKHRFDVDESLRKPMHCGHCVPCLIRRASIVAGIGKDTTTYTIANLRARVLDTNKAEGEHVRSFQHALRQLAKTPSRARFDIHKPGPLIDHPDDLEAYEKVYLDGMREVGRLLRGVRAAPL
jgi:hypothetical protein